MLLQSGICLLRCSELYASIHNFKMIVCRSIHICRQLSVEVNSVMLTSRACLATSNSNLRQQYKYPDPEKEERLELLRYSKSSDSERRVYVWGLAEHGALGNQLQLKQPKKPQYYKHRPTRLHFAEQHKISDVTSGYGFTAFAIKTKGETKVFGCGINTDSQIGYHATKRNHPLDIILAPAPVEIPIVNPSTTQVTRLASGRAHLLVLTNDEGAFLLGNNAYGQCGRRIIENEDYSASHIVHNIKDIDGVKIKDIQCGQDHSMLLLEKGEIYSFGWGADGQTGLGHYVSTYQPSLVVGDTRGENIIKISCAGDCVLALNDKGQVFGWGNSEYNQLPVNGDSQQVNTSTHLKFTEEMGKVKDIASGGTFCLILTESDQVFVWGYGLLGKGPKVDRSVVPTLIPATLFGQNQFSPETKVVSLAAGLSHMAAITNNGDLYMWGRNRGGCLGLGHSKDQFFPLKVAIGAFAIKVCLGVDHTVALCKPFLNL